MSSSDTSNSKMSSSDTSSSGTSNPEMSAPDTSAPGISTPYMSNRAKLRTARKQAYRNQTAVDFSKIWPRMLIVSVVLILVSIGSFLLRGVNLGIEFEGALLGSFHLWIHPPLKSGTLCARWVWPTPAFKSSAATPTA